MKYVIARAWALVATFTLLCVTLATGVQAQTADTQIKINIPFDFYVGSKKLPAGNYRLTQPAQTTPALIVSGEHSSTSVLTSPTTNRYPTQPTVIVFNKYTDRLFMSEVRLAGYGIGRKLAPSAMELELARNAVAERVLAAGKSR